ncbi:MAG: hypothetical protein M3Y76_08200 [Chloroflexota bacterium]|nr:hypothetical protein [Chloroflexota bacterium]
MDGAVTPVQANTPENVTTTTTPTTTDTLSQQQIVCNAASLGWAISELLGRCYQLNQSNPASLDWSGNKLIKLQENFTPREKLFALVKYIIFLADSLDVSACVIEDDPAKRRYIDVLANDIKLFIHHNLDPTLGITFEQLRGRINQNLFYWDLNIHDALQDKPTVVDKAYLVGRTLASLRWYFGQPDVIQDSSYMEKICNEYVPMLQPYVSPYATGAMTNSLNPWWHAISSGHVQPDPTGDVPIELKNQANIWFSLATNEREAQSYAPASIKSRGYILKVFQVFWPFFLIGALVLALILALLLYVIVSNFNLLTKEVSAVIALLAAFGITHTLIDATGNILQKAVSEATGTFKGTFIDNIKHSTQQEAINKATLIPPSLQKGAKTIKLK